MIVVRTVHIRDLSGVLKITEHACDKTGSDNAVKRVINYIISEKDGDLHERTDTSLTLFHFTKISSDETKDTFWVAKEAIIIEGTPEEIQKYYLYFNTILSNKHYDKYPGSRQTGHAYRGDVHADLRAKMEEVMRRRGFTW